MFGNSDIFEIELISLDMFEKNIQLEYFNKMILWNLGQDHASNIHINNLAIIHTILKSSMHGGQIIWSNWSTSIPTPFIAHPYYWSFNTSICKLMHQTMEVTMLLFSPCISMWMMPCLFTLLKALLFQFPKCAIPCSMSCR